LPAFISVRLSRALDDIVVLFGEEILITGTAPDTGERCEDIPVGSIELECFRILIQRDGFGPVFWNESGEEAFASMEVIDEKLIGDFTRLRQLPTTGTVQ
jgi:hypothetical protein